MKKRNFVLTGIALGLSVFATSLSAQAAIPNEIVEQGSLAPVSYTHLEHEVGDFLGLNQK